MEKEVIDDFATVRLLINVYMIKKLKSSIKPINQEKFIEEVWLEFKNKNLNYSSKSILFTWKNLLDNYQHYKKNFAVEDAKKNWKYFDLMDNCFDDSVPTSAKFNDPKWTLCLIESLSKYRETVLTHGLTMDILQTVEDDFRKLGNFNITQKDIYNQWLILKKIYKKYLSHNLSRFKNYLYCDALKNFFANDRPFEHSTKVINKTNKGINQNELNIAIASITSVDGNIEMKKRKIDHSGEVAEPTCTSKSLNGSSDKEACAEFTPFSIVMHDILLQCFKRNKKKISLTSEVDDDILNEVFTKFQKLGYNVSKMSICNEWNDLTCRYELIKNTEQPEKWPYYSDIHYIYTSEDVDDTIYNEEVINDTDSENNVETLLMKNLKGIQKISYNNVEISERLLNVYECNNKEFLEIKDILLERNLLREETNYLLNTFIEKFYKRKH